MSEINEVAKFNENWVLFERPNKGYDTFLEDTLLQLCLNPVINEDPISSEIISLSADVYITFDMIFPEKNQSHHKTYEVVFGGMNESGTDGKGFEMHYTGYAEIFEKSGLSKSGLPTPEKLENVLRSRKYLTGKKVFL